MPRPQAIPVEQLDRKTGEVVAQYKSVRDAAIAIGKVGGHGNINNAANGKVKSVYGYMWRYVLNDDADADDTEQWKPFGSVEVSSRGRIKRFTVSGQSFVSEFRTKVTINNVAWTINDLVNHVFHECHMNADNRVSSAVNLDPRYIAGMFDGDGSINISKVGPAGKQGYLLKAEISQCNEAFLNTVNASLGGTGKVYKDSRESKYLGETSWTLRFCGKAAKPLLDIIATHGIIKAKQAHLALKFLDLPRMGAKDAKEQARLAMSALNADKSYEKPMSHMNEPYIAGLFDAEGNVFCSVDEKGKKRMYVKITQKSDPAVLQRITDYLGYGTVSEESRWKIYSRENIAAFHVAMATYLHIKKDQLDALVSSFECP
jgi:hypothetical protein